MGDKRMLRVAVFCGSKVGNRPEYAAEARRFGELLARRGLGVVFGGGHIGLMGVLADAALGAGGEVIGVIPHTLVERELAHRSLTELRVVDTMHQRKAVMADLADVIVALPGGYGTADELFEMLTWAQLRLHAKPIGLLNTADYFTPLLTWVEHCVQEGFMKASHRDLLRVAGEPETLLAACGLGG